jgi:hypothetical protein
MVRLGYLLKAGWCGSLSRIDVVKELVFRRGAILLHGGDIERGILLFAEHHPGIAQMILQEIIKDKSLEGLTAHLVDLIDITDPALK